MSALVSRESDITISTTIKPVFQAEPFAVLVEIENRGTTSIFFGWDPTYTGTVLSELQPGDIAIMSDEEDGDAINAPLMAKTLVSTATLHVRRVVASSSE